MQGEISRYYLGHSLFLPHWFVRKRGLAIGIAFSGVGVGAIILFPWLQTLIERLGWRRACWTMAILVALTLLPLNLFLQRHRPEDMGLAPDGDVMPQTTGVAAAAVASNVVDAAWVATDWTLARALKTGQTWPKHPLRQCGNKWI